MTLRNLICLAVLGLAAACGSDPDDTSTDAGRAASPSARSVILFTIDTLRADRLSPYGYEQHRTPAVERLASQALIFDRAYSQGTQTNPALTSILTGLVPPRHGVLAQTTKPKDNVITLAAMLSAQGFVTGSFAANLCELQKVAGSVWEEGWTHTFCGMSDEPQRVWGHEVLEAGLEWISEQQQAQRPFFAWIHLMDPHGEWDPDPQQWDHAAKPVRSKADQSRHFGQFEADQVFPPADELAQLNGLYDAEVRGSDALLGRLLDSLDLLPDSEEIALIFSADHGEELFDSWPRLTHGASMTEGVLRVPLMIRAQGVEPRRTDAVVETLCITPTVLDLLGAQAPYALDGRSLLAGAPELPYARSYSMPPVVTLRSSDLRIWVRCSVGPPQTPIAVPWRVEVPWYQEPESAARYADGAPTTPIWFDPDELDADAPEGRLRVAARRAAAEAQAGSSDLSEISDPEYLQQLIELGYLTDIER